MSEIAVQPELSLDEPLSDRDLAMLATERLRWKHAGAKEAEVRRLFGLSVPQYDRQLDRLIDRGDVLALDPPLVKRLRAMRAARQRARESWSP